MEREESLFSFHDIYVLSLKPKYLYVKGEIKMEIENKGIMQGFAGSIEQTLRKELGLRERGGLGGVADADHIRNKKGAFYHCMIMLLAFHFSEENSAIVDKFIYDVADIMELKMDNITNKRAEEIYEYFEKIYGKISKKHRQG